jgi:phosphoribosylformylglycinamidine synthase
MTAKALILAGYGLNCEEETLHAFKHNSIDGNIIHINDLIQNPDVLNQYQILAIPGGFSYGDDTGSGNAYAQKIRLSLMDHIHKFIGRDTLTIGICNGCQILTNLGLINGTRDIAVTYNENNRYQCRWIDVAINESNTSPWLRDIDRMHIPVAHGEGRFMMEDKTLAAIQSRNQIAAQYIKPDGTPANGQFPYNPNGSTADIAAMTDATGRILAIMPHPERGMFTWQRDDYDMLKDTAQREGRALPEAADGMQLFANAATYFEVKKKAVA